MLIDTLSAAGQQQLPDILHDAHAAADGQRHEDLLRRAADHVIQRVARFDAGGDVEEGQLVRTLAVIEPGLLHRIAGIDQIDEVHPLTTRPSLTSRQGIRRILSIYASSGAGEESSASASRRIDPAVIEGAAADDAFDAGMLLRLQRFQVSMLDTPPDAITGVVSAKARSAVASTLTPPMAPSRLMSV